VTSPFAEVLAAVAAGAPVALATVIGVRGSTPRHLGARMAIAADGRTWGTIGGGRIEAEVVAAGRAVAAGGRAVTVEHHLVRDLAMCCGGAMQLAIAPAAASADAIAEVVAARARREARVVTTPADGSPLRVRRPGAGDVAALARPRRDAEGLVELVRPADRVVLFGLGHVARAIGPIVAGLGFEVVVCDDGETGAVEGAAPGWASAVVDSFAVADAERALGRFGPGDLVLIVTRDHAVDQRVLEALIGRDDLGYLGMIGSRGKLGRFKKRLAAKGLGDDAAWARLRAPIGLDLGAETPEEIAVAVAAELVAWRRRGTPAAGDWGRGDSGEAP
jgi:xanthine dehydrogenase accessory factor